MAMSPKILRTIRKAREGRKLSIRAFARILNLSPSYYSKFERGLATPSIFTLEHIARWLGLDLVEVVHGAGLMDSETADMISDLYRANPTRLRRVLRGMAAKKKGGG